MIFKINSSDSEGLSASQIVTGTASAMILCTALAFPKQPRPEIEGKVRGRELMMTVTTNRGSCAEFFVDDGVRERAENAIKFYRLVDQWKRERKLYTSVATMSMLGSYQGIIGMGKPALPLILAQLKAEGNSPDHWFWALAAIAKDVNPVPPESRGKVAEMAKAWLAWGQQQGYVD
jgi:hypothetical protein